MEYVELSQEEWKLYGATAGMATLVGRIRALRDGRDIIDAGQGAELSLASDSPLLAALTEDLDGNGVTLKQVLQTGEYHTNVGGPIITTPAEIMNARAMVADHMRNIYRVPATAENTFLLQTLGRGGVARGMHDMASGPIEKLKAGKITPGKMNIGMAREHWGTLKVLAEDEHLDVVTYENREDDTALAVKRAFFEGQDLARMAGLTFVSPSNPTSQVIHADHMRQIVSMVSNANRSPDVNMHLLFDFPYAFACDTNLDSRGHYLQTGLEHALDDVDNVPWSLVVSTSKMMSLAPVGYTVVVIDPARAEAFGGKISRNGVGLGRIDQLSLNIARLLGGDKQDVFWDHTATLRDKYKGNDRALEEKFPQYMVPGAPNGVLRLMDIPASEVFGKAVNCSDGHTRVLKDGNDVVTFLANEFSLAAVSCGTTGDQWHLRLAKREMTDRFNKLAGNLLAGLEVLRNAPTAVTSGGTPPDKDGGRVIPFPQAVPEQVGGNGSAAPAAGARPQPQRYQLAAAQARPAPGPV